MKKLLGAFTYLVVAAAGFYTGFIFSKKKYENLAEEEVKSVKKSLEEYYEGRCLGKPDEESNRDEPLDDDGSIKKEIPKVKKTETEEYKDYSEPYRNPESDGRIAGKPSDDIIEEGGTGKSDTPYIITPAEFGESNYEAKELFYYRDNVLADSDDNIVNDVRECIGDGLDHMGMYEEGCIHVRNDILGIDYEVLSDERTFGDISNNNNPGVVESE